MFAKMPKGVPDGLAIDRAADQPQTFQSSTVQALGACEIEIGLVNRNHFNDRRKFSEDGRNPVAPL